MLMTASLIVAFSVLTRMVRSISMALLSIWPMLLGAGVGVGQVESSSSLGPLLDSLWSAKGCWPVGAGSWETTMVSSSVFFAFIGAASGFVVAVWRLAAMDDKALRARFFELSRSKRAGKGGTCPHGAFRLVVVVLSWRTFFLGCLGRDPKRFSCSG